MTSALPAGPYVADSRDLLLTDTARDDPFGGPVAVAAWYPVDGMAPRTDLGLLPVVVFSPGVGVPGGFYANAAAALASNGFVVLVLSDVGAMNNQWQDCLTARTGDFEYVMNLLPTLPNGIGAVIDTTRVGAAGHSYGGYTAMQHAYTDVRIKSIFVLDGTCGWPGTTSSPQYGGLPYRQPVFLFTTAEKPSAAEHASWTSFQAQPHGPLRITQTTGAAQCATYAVDFFDHTLRGGPGVLTQGPSAAYPEVTFVVNRP